MKKYALILNDFTGDNPKIIEVSTNKIHLKGRKKELEKQSEEYLKNNNKVYKARLNFAVQYAKENLHMFNLEYHGNPLEDTVNGNWFSLLPNKNFIPIKITDPSLKAPEEPEHYGKNLAIVEYEDKDDET